MSAVVSSRRSPRLQVLNEPSVRIAIAASRGRAALMDLFERLDENVVGVIDVVQCMRPLGQLEHRPLVYNTRHGPWLEHAVEHTKAHMRPWRPSYESSRCRNYTLRATTSPAVPLSAPCLTPRTPGSWAKKPGWSPRGAHGAFGTSSPRHDSRAPAFTDGRQRAALVDVTRLASPSPTPAALAPSFARELNEVSARDVPPHFSSLRMQLAQRPTRQPQWRVNKKE